MDDLIPEKKQNSTTRATVSGGRTSSASNVMCKPLTKTNSTSSQQSPKLTETGNNADVATTRSNTSENTSLENELKVGESIFKLRPQKFKMIYYSKIFQSIKLIKCINF